MEHYKKLLIEERPEYRIKTQPYIQREGEDINIGIEYVG